MVQMGRPWKSRGRTFFGNGVVPGSRLFGRTAACGCLFADVDGSGTEVDFEGAGAGAGVGAGDDEVAVVAAGAVVVKGAQADIDGEIAVAVVAAGGEVDGSGADVDFAAAGGADGVEVEVSAAEVDLGFGAGVHGEFEGDGGVGVAREPEVDGGGVGLDVDAIDEVLGGVAGGLIAEIDGEAEVVEIAAGPDGDVGGADLELEFSGAGEGTGEFEMAGLDEVAGLRREVVRGGAVAVAGIGVGIGVGGLEAGGLEAERKEHGCTQEEMVAHGPPWGGSWGQV